MREHGHHDPGRYTPGQIQLYLEAIWRQERKQQRERIRETAIAHRIAMFDKDAFKTEMRKLSGPKPDNHG